MNRLREYWLNYFAYLRWASWHRRQSKFSPETSVLSAALALKKIFPDLSPRLLRKRSNRYAVFQRMYDFIPAYANWSPQEIMDRLFFDTNNRLSRLMTNLLTSKTLLLYSFSTNALPVLWIFLCAYYQKHRPGPLRLLLPKQAWQNATLYFNRIYLEQAEERLKADEIFIYNLGEPATVPFLDIVKEPGLIFYVADALTPGINSQEWSYNGHTFYFSSDLLEVATSFHLPILSLACSFINYRFTYTKTPLLQLNFLDLQGGKRLVTSEALQRPLFQLLSRFPEGWSSLTLFMSFKPRFKPLPKKKLRREFLLSPDSFFSTKYGTQRLIINLIYGQQLVLDDKVYQVLRRCTSAEQALSQFRQKKLNITAEQLDSWLKLLTLEQPL